ncbi:DUF732 domain-containing protein [Mycolicibacterium hodleri]|uniref:DUF732 domain-containing protein n=1 Tax=Mycolicibacterium hodleri TaxID=49897 RepID=UPI0021F3430C|nr:DUF732 domain-containing protein [Mycolicibacterium hodleri]
MTVITGLIDVSAKASMAMALSVGIVVAASATPATARADAVSDQFLAALTGSGVSVADPNMAVSMAQSICPMLVKPGGDFASVASQMGGTNGVSPGMANLFTSIAISMYCPSMMASLANGNWIGQGAQMGLPGLSGLGIPGF